MKYTFIIAIILLMYILSCDNENNQNEPISKICNTTDPINELNWLNEMVNIPQDRKIGRMEVYKCIYDSIEGFIVDQCVDCPDFITYFYDCDGNIICEFGGYDGRITCPDFSKKVTSQVLIYKD